MIFLFTDYGLEGSYLGQVETVLYQQAPNEKVINLIADAPRNNPKASAYLLASLITQISTGSILFCVVDPGVGSDKDMPVILKIDGCWFIGPDNGLFDLVVRQAREIDVWEIIWKPEKLSNSFHGRDLYAPVCGMLINEVEVPCNKVDWQDMHGWPDDLNEIIYIDHFGNCMTGIRTETVNKKTIIKTSNQEISKADTFSDVSKGHAFWYINSNGLVEIAVNQGRACDVFGITIGSKIDC